MNAKIGKSTMSDLKRLISFSATQILTGGNEMGANTEDKATNNHSRHYFCD
jgi:hypothetical protein